MHRAWHIRIYPDRNDEVFISVLATADCGATRPKRGGHKGQEYGSTVLAATLDAWIQEGREDLIVGDTETAFARFATAFDERKRRPNAKAGS